MTFTVTYDWSLPALGGQVLFWPLPSGSPVEAQILAGVLCAMDNTPGVPLPSQVSGVPQYYRANFSVFVGGQAAIIPTFSFVPGSGSVDLGAIYPGITPPRIIRGRSVSAPELSTTDSLHIKDASDIGRSLMTAVDQAAVQTIVGASGGSADEYHEYATFGAFPGTGVADRLYVDISTTPATLYRWSGSAYVLAGVGAVSSVAGRAGAVTLTADDTPDGTTNKAYTAADKTRLAGTSGTNTGDQTSVTGNAGTATKLATARNINGVAFDGTANITVADATKSPLLTTVTVLTANTAPTKFQSTSYDASGGALSVPLPALSGLSAGDWYGVQRYQLDTSTNAITFTANGSDTFDSGATSFSPSLPGELRYLQVVTVASVKRWKVAYGNTPLGSTDRRYGTQNRGNVAIWFGDSIGTAQDMIVGSANLVDPTIRSESTFAWASILSGQRLRYFRNASKGGDNAATAMARWDADVAPYNFSVLVWALGTNDSFLQTTVAAYAAQVKEAHAKTRAKGADFIICTVPPNDNLSGSPANRKSLIVQYNQFLRDYAAKWGLILIDMFDLLSDTSGNYASGYSTDKTHPIAVGYRAMGALVADTLALYLPPFSAPLPRTTTDANLLTEPLFLGGLNGSFVPTGWSMPSGVLRTGVTASLVTSDTDIKGNWYKMVVANTFSGPQTIFQTISSGITAGRQYRFIGRIKMLSPVGITITARIAYDANFDYTGDATNTHEFRSMSGLGGAIPSGVFWFDSTAPTSASTAQINIQIVGNGGTGEVHLAQIGVYDITDVQAALV